MSTTTLKIIALILMLLDHIALFIPGMPIWFSWLGRISAPLFLYCVIWGFIYTSDKAKYLTRLYLFGIGMAVLNLIFNFLYSGPAYYVANNFITTLFLVVFVIYLIHKNEWKYYVLFGIWQLVNTAMSMYLVEFIQIPYFTMSSAPSYMFYGSVFGNVLHTEGGPLFIILGVVFYLTRNNVLKLTVYYSGISILVYFLVKRYSSPYGIAFYLVPFENYQWMMIGALPFMLLYNHKKGPGFKYAFYVFYPLHIILLLIIGSFHY